MADWAAGMANIGYGNAAVPSQNPYGLYDCGPNMSLYTPQHWTGVGGNNELMQPNAWLQHEDDPLVAGSHVNSRPAQEGPSQNGHDRNMPRQLDIRFGISDGNGEKEHMTSDLGNVTESQDSSSAPSTVEASHTTDGRSATTPMTVVGTRVSHAAATYTINSPRTPTGRISINPTSRTTSPTSTTRVTGHGYTSINPLARARNSEEIDVTPSNGHERARDRHLMAAQESNWGFACDDTALVSDLEGRMITSNEYDNDNDNDDNNDDDDDDDDDNGQHATRRRPAGEIVTSPRTPQEEFLADGYDQSEIAQDRQYLFPGQSSMSSSTPSDLERAISRTENDVIAFTQPEAVGPISLYRAPVGEDRETALREVLAVAGWMGLYCSNVHAGRIGLLFSIDEYHQYQENKGRREKRGNRENREKSTNMEELRVPSGRFAPSVRSLLATFRYIRTARQPQDLCGYCALISGEPASNILFISEERSINAWVRWRTYVENEFGDR